MLYDFLAPLIFLFSLAGIFVIILRKVPSAAEGSAPTARTSGTFTSTASRLLRRFGKFLQPLLARLWAFLREVKEFPTTSAKLPLFIRQSRDRFHLSSADSYVEQGRFSEAEEAFLSLIKKDPKNRRAYEGLGRMYLEKEAFPEAIETYTFLLKQDPANLSYHTALGRAFYACKRFAEAKEAFLAALSLDQHTAHRYINVGLCHAALGELADAATTYEKAIELEPANTQYLLLLAESLAAQGMTERSEELLDKILQIDPTHHDARERLMQIRFADDDETK